MKITDFNSNNNNEWAIILGGSSGLGLASAKKLAAHGMHNCIIHRTRRSKIAAFEMEIETLRSNGSQILEFNLDAFQSKNQEKVIEAIKEKGGVVKVLLHSLAKGNLKPIYSENSEQQSLTATDFDLTITAMATSLYSWAKTILDANCFAKGSRILSFTSEGSKKPLPNYAAVSAAKAALEAITRSLAYELAPLGITSNCIQAGVTDTESLRLIPNSGTILEHAKNRNPGKRLTTPEDVANMVYLLLKPEANWVNGTVIEVDGGEHLSP